MHPDCSTRGEPKSAKRGCEHHTEMSEMLFSRPMETKRSPLWTSPSSPNTPICFKNLVVGARRLGMLFPSEGQWPQFAAEVKKNLNLPSHPTLYRQKIVIFRKNGRRTFVNYDELADHLRKRFAVSVELVDPTMYGIREQLVKLSDATVVISPCGGVSFTAMFVPPGASAIFAE